MRECQECEDYNKCPFGEGKAWYHYGEIRWCPFQVIWILEHRGAFLAGDWVDNPDGSSYTDPAIQTGFRSESYFTKPEEVIAQVEDRLKTTGIAGEALVDEVDQGLTFQQLSRPAQSALMYVKGWRQKKQTFPEWMRDWRRGKTYKTSHKNDVLSHT